MDYLVFIHIIAAIILLGNIITAAFWKIRAEFSKDPSHINRAVRNVMFADYVFTLPGILLLLITGFALAMKSNYPLQELNWLTASLVLFIVTGMIWGFILVPLQRKMIRYSNNDELQKAEYTRVSRTWDIIGTIAVMIPLVILYLMVTKPF